TRPAGSISGHRREVMPCTCRREPTFRIASANCGCRSRRYSSLTGKVAALLGFKSITDVSFPPLICLVEMTHLYFVGFRMLCKPVAKSEVAIETHEFSKINIGNTRVASNDEHVLVVIRS